MEADTIGGTIGISQPPNAESGLFSWRVNARYGTSTAVSSPPMVPMVHRTQSMVTAAGRPTQSLPSRSVPAPTVRNAIGGAP